MHSKELCVVEEWPHTPYGLFKSFTAKNYFCIAELEHDKKKSEKNDKAFQM